jgi:hypothetical protein
LGERKERNKMKESQESFFSGMKLNSSALAIPRRLRAELQANILKNPEFLMKEKFRYGKLPSYFFKTSGFHTLDLKVHMFFQPLDLISSWKSHDQESGVSLDWKGTFRSFGSG